MNKIIQGDALSVLKGLPAESVQLTITSPPYFSLRAYNTEPQIWGGSDSKCEHEWQGKVGRAPDNSKVATGKPCDSFRSAKYLNQPTFKPTTNFCSKCSAWRGELGLEPTPELYLDHLVTIFREVRRVLHKTGLLVVNMGDSYVASKTGDPISSSTLQGGKVNQIQCAKRPTKKSTGYYKPKDLMLMPSRLAMELQKDGWWLRSMIPWIKWEMPESVEDRPSGKIEYFFMLSKSKNCYWDQEAIKVPSRPETWGLNKQGEYHGEALTNYDTALAQNPSEVKSRIAKTAEDGTRIRRVRDWFDESFRGLYCDDEPLALIVNSVPFPHKTLGSHFATFAPKAIEPFVMAGTSEKGQCAKCGNPYERIVDYKANYTKREKAHVPNNIPSKVDSSGWKEPTIIQKGWRPTCKCQAETVPQTILDPFFGSGTVGLVALRAGRRYIGIELSPDYIEIARKRLAPLEGQERLI